MGWVKAQTDQLPATPLPQEKPLSIIEMDELCTFIGKKKAVCLVTLVERSISCKFGWEVKFERDEPTLQALLDRTLQAVWYFSDLFSTHKA